MAAIGKTFRDILGLVGIHRAAGFSFARGLTDVVRDEADVMQAIMADRLICDDIPVRVRERCKDLLLDALACALAGYLGEDTPKVSRFAAALGKSGESSIIGGGRLSLTGATALNGFLITSVSLCDVYRPTATHLQPVVVPPALAIAEREGASGRDLLTALTAGFEVTTRIGAGLDYPAFRQHDLKADAVSRMRIHLSKSSYEAYANRRTISGKWEASGSVYYTASVVLHDCDLWMDQFEPARFNDPAVRRFALEQVELVSDAGLSGVQAVVDVEMKTGATLTARCDEPKGTPENRMTRTEIEGKFRKGAQGRLGAAQVDAVIGAVARLEELSSVRALMDVLRAGKQ